MPHKEKRWKEIKMEKEITSAELEAKADMISAPKEEKSEQEKEKGIPFVIPLSMEYKFGEEKIKEVDLSGLVNLNTLDGQEIDRVMEAMNWHPRSKFRDTLYTKHIAMRVTGYPVEFFNALSWKDMEGIKDRITIFFLYD